VKAKAAINKLRLGEGVIFQAKNNKKKITKHDRTIFGLNVSNCRMANTKS
jgi:hypothetical protein